MRPSDHCQRLDRRLKSCGLESATVRHVPGEGYYVAPVKATSAYGAYGAGSEFYANHLQLHEAEAFVGGMCAAVRRAQGF